MRDDPNLTVLAPTQIIAIDDRRLLQNFAIALTDEQTATLPNEVYYDVLLTNPSGLKEYYLEGIIYVSEGYTA